MGRLFVWKVIIVNSKDEFRKAIQLLNAGADK